MVRSIYFALALLFGSAAVGAARPSSVSAQESSAARAEAKRLFEQGLSNARSNRWDEALLSFRRSSVLVNRASTSFNIANALYRLDRPVDGLEELDRYESLSEVRYDQSAQQRGEELRRLLEEVVAEIRLMVTPYDALLHVDGTLFPVPGFERRLRLNPGSHSLRVTHDDYATASRELHLERGGRQSLEITLEPLPVAPGPDIDVMAASEPSAEAPSDRDRFVKRPGFWVMIGAIVVVGVGTGVAIAMTRRDDAPQCGTTGDCASTAGLTLRSF